MNVDIATHILANTDQAVPTTMAEAFPNLEHLNIITPNIAVHNYDEIDLAITYKIGRHHLEDFKDYIRQIVSFHKLDDEDKNE